MADESLLNLDEITVRLIVTTMRGARAMTSREIAKVASKRGGRRIDGRRVESILTPIACGLVIVANMPACRVVRLRRRGLFQRSTRWQLVEAPASPPDTAGAPVPAWPYRPMLSGAAAAPLTFRRDEPPTDAIGKSA